MHRTTSLFFQRSFRVPYRPRYLSIVPETHEKNVEYSTEPEYPPLFDASVLGKRQHNRRLWYDRIRAMPTFEEKMLAICKGFFNKEDKDIRVRVCNMPGLYKRYNTLPLQLNCTRTHLIKGQLPTNLLDDTGQLTADQLDEVVKLVKPIVLDAVRDVYGGKVKLHWQSQDITRRDRMKLDRENGQRMVDSVFRAITLESNLQHLNESQVDYNPRCDAFWVKGDFPPDVIRRDIRKNLLKKFKDIEQPNDPVDIWFQYCGFPYLQVRGQLPLSEVVGRNDPLCTEFNVPEFQHDPRSAGYTYTMRNASSVPGFWPTDPCNFGYVSFHTREKGLIIDEMFGKEALGDSILGLGVISSFSWLAALATHNGFNTFNELTYPLTTQTVVTNGHLWSFFMYQLNSITLGLDFEKKFQNICWATEEHKLFETVEGDEVKGFNDDVLKTLVTFLTRKPREVVDFDLRPYLRKPDCTEDELAAIRSIVKYKYSNRPVSNHHPETPLWELIYKKKFQAKID